MKVLLIVPTFNYKKAYPSFLSVSDFPAGYGYLASSLQEAGHEVYGLNLNNITGYLSAYSMIHDRITDAIKEVKPDLIGMGGLCIDYKFLKDAIGIIRQTTDTPIVMGGGIVTHDADYIFNLLKPDFCIIGEGEKPIVQLAKQLMYDGRRYDHIDNFGYWEDGRAVFTTRNYNYPNVDDLPLPDWESFGIKNMLDNYSASTRFLYRYPRTHPKPMIIVTARGCPFNCSFCVHQGDRRYRPRSIENIMQEIKLMYERYGFNILIIQDELFAVNNQRMREFCATLIENKSKYGWDFDWMFQTHANARLDYEALKLAKEAGCYFFSYGLESASPTILASMNKKIKVSQIVEAIELANSVGIGFGGNLLWGDIAESEETIRETLSFFMKYGTTNSIFFGWVSPYPGSKLFDVCVERGIIKDRLNFYETIDESLWNMTTLPDELWAQWVQFLSDLERFRPLLFKSTNVTHYEKDTELHKDPIALCVKQMFWKMWAICPHCGKKLCYREMASGLDGRKHLLVIAGNCTHCGKTIRVNVLDSTQEVKCGIETN